MLSQFPSHQALGRKALGVVSENCEVLIKTIFPPVLLVSLLKHVWFESGVKTVIDGLLRKCWSPIVSLMLRRFEQVVLFSAPFMEEIQNSITYNEAQNEDQRS